MESKLGRDVMTSVVDRALRRRNEGAAWMAQVSLHLSCDYYLPMPGVPLVKGF